MIRKFRIEFITEKTETYLVEGEFSAQEIKTHAEQDMIDLESKYLGNSETSHFAILSECPAHHSWDKCFEDRGRFGHG